MDEDDKDLVIAHLELVDDGLRDLVKYVVESEINNHYKLSLVSKIVQILDVMPMVA